ncbi:MAG: hypothetical protein ACOCZB_08900, partial [Spirochaetota bacterium]
TGKYFRLSDYGRRILFVMIGAAMAATETTKLELLQATDEEGSDSKVFDSTAADNAEKTVTANEEVIEATVALATAAATDVVTVNGTEFTMAGATDVDANEFADAAGLVSCINASVDGVFASADATTVTIRSANGRASVTVEKTESSGTITLATTEHLVYVEVEADDLDVANGFEYVAARVTTTADSVVGVLAVRMDGRFSPDQIGVGKFM